MPKQLADNTVCQLGHKGNELITDDAIMTSWINLSRLGLSVNDLQHMHCCKLFEEKVVKATEVFY